MVWHTGNVVHYAASSCKEQVLSFRGIRTHVLRTVISRVLICSLDVGLWKPLVLSPCVYPVRTDHEISLWSCIPFVGTNELLLVMCVGHCVFHYTSMSTKLRLAEADMPTAEYLFGSVHNLSTECPDARDINLTQIFCWLIFACLSSRCFTVPMSRWSRLVRSKHSTR